MSQLSARSLFASHNDDGQFLLGTTPDGKRFDPGIGTVDLLEMLSLHKLIESQVADHADSNMVVLPDWAMERLNAIVARRYAEDEPATAPKGETLAHYLHRNVEDAISISARLHAVAQARLELKSALADEARYQNRKVQDVYAEHPLGKMLDNEMGQLRARLVELI